MGSEYFIDEPHVALCDGKVAELLDADDGAMGGGLQKEKYSDPIFQRGTYVREQIKRIVWFSSLIAT
ncbi:hypothetical protein BM527_13700 [Alteromonas sp. Mex14]|nr:hypothetical protein BM527_13700 [Alteromonas sp. Mex14]